MPKVLTNQQVREFQEQGFISCIDVMSEHEAASYLARLEEIETNFPEEVNPENRNNAHLSFCSLDELVHHPVIVDAVEDLIGANISLWGSVLFIKEPSSKGFVSWHQDGTYMGLNPMDFCTPWLALTPSNLVNGCMSMIPGSHKQNIRNHVDTFEEDNILTRGQVVPDVDESTAYDLILKAGQMSIHHAEIIHGSRPNRSQQRRVGYAMQAFMGPHVRQVVGKNYWLDIRGQNPRDDSVNLPRPQYDMDPISNEGRRLVNENWSEILYSGSQQKRAY
ncbi:MAG: non-heme Fe2+,alpha-ketoglutarate-dependent halogenase [Parasphingorhabdus sp.]|jgi:non-heme Fe2+,alpha-ketoglutarate-dependent halogenase